MPAEREILKGQIRERVAHHPFRGRHLAPHEVHPHPRQLAAGRNRGKPDFLESAERGSQHLIERFHREEPLHKKCLIR